MSRSKHQFRPGALEVCETRIVPTVTPIPGPPFVPPGQAADYDNSTHFTATGVTGDPGFNTGDPGFVNPGAGFGINGDIIESKVTNTDPVNSPPRYATFAVYRAPGGGSVTNSPSDSLGSENLRSQKLIYSATSDHALAPGESYTFSVDISKLDQTGPGINGNHLTGDDDFQCDDFDAGYDSNGYAPEKLNEAALDTYIFAGELFNYDDSSTAGKKHK